MSERADQQPQRRSTAEKVSLAVALLLLAGVVGMVLFLWITDEGSEASFTVTAGQARVVGDQFYLPVTLANTGDETASQVLLEGRLSGATGEESASTTFDFVPGHSSVEGVLIFSGDPSAAEVRVVSYQAP